MREPIFRDRFQNIIAAALGIGMLLAGTAKPAAASTPATIRVRPPQALLNPSIPPLDDPSIYLPRGELPVRLELRLGERRVYVLRGDTEVASYPVAVGKPGWETPTGTFQVIQKVENPMWQNPWSGEVRPAGEDSALGLRWIGFWSDGKDTIGFHGTPTVNSIGQAASHGCVRMYNEDVVALFEQVELGTPVTVVP